MAANKHMHTTVFLLRVVGANGASLPTGVSESLPKYIDVIEKEEAQKKYPLGKAGNLWGGGKRENALEKKASRESEHQKEKWDKDRKNWETNEWRE